MITAVFSPIVTSLGLDVSTVILNDSLSSTLMSSVTLMLRHTELLTDVVKGIVMSSSDRGLKSLTPGKENAVVEESHIYMPRHSIPYVLTPV